MNVWLYGLLVAVVGMVIVFTGLVLLIAIITVQAGVFGAAKGKKTKQAPKQELPAAAPAPAAPAVKAVEADDDEEIAVVIAAAIAMLESESGSNGLRVRSIRRIGSNAPVWSAAGRRDYLGSRY